MLFLASFTQAQAQTICPEGIISIHNNNTESALCVRDGDSYVIRFVTNTAATPFGYVVADENDIIVFIGTSNNIDFENLPLGSLNVYAFSFIGQILGQVGDPLFDTELASICYNITDNFINISNESPTGGQVTTDDGLESLFLCIGDGVANEINFTSTGTGGSQQFLITDTDANLLAVSDGTFDFENADIGVCLVWSINYVGDFSPVIGENIFDQDFDAACFAISENSVEVTRLFPDAGTLAYSDGTNDYVSCTEVAPTETLSLQSFNANPDVSYTYVVVNAADGNIVSFLLGNEVVLADLSDGVYQIYGVSYTGDLIVGVGDSFNGQPLSNECDDRSDNFATLTKRVQDAGGVLLADGSDNTTICVGDGIADELSFQSTYMGNDNFIYLITDENNVLLNTSEDATIDFEGAGAGICRVWGLAYSGSLSVVMGDIVGEVDLSDECFNLSDSFVVVNRNGPNGGSLSFDNGETTLLFCSGGSTVSNVTTSGATMDLIYSYIIVNSETNLIAAVSSDPTVDANNLDFGSYTIYGVSHISPLTLMVGADFDADAVSADCYDLSDNTLSLANRSVDAGTVAFTDGSTSAIICPNDGTPDFLSFESDYAGADNFIFAILAADGTILSFNTSGSEDFDTPGDAQISIVGIAYSGNLILQIGTVLDENTVISTECYDLSDDQLTIDRNGPNGGNVSLDNGDTTIDICAGDGAADVLIFNTDGQGTQMVWLITDSDNNILAFNDTGSMDFEDADEGTCLIWALAYQGDLLVIEGDNIDGATFATDCSSLSSNAITVNRTFVDGGTVAISDGSTMTVVCGGDGVPDFYEFVATQSDNNDYSFIVTDDNNDILGILESNSIDFDEAAPGNCRVWGVSHADALTAQIGDNLDNTALSAACYELSSNFITVIREQVDGGTVSIEGGALEMVICPFDNNPDVVTFENTGSTTGFYRYILTDTSNIILGVITGDNEDFNNISGPNELRVWGLAYTPLITAPTGQNILEIALSSNCFDLSDNYVTIIRAESNGGSLATTSGETSLSLCTSDGIDDFVEVAITGQSAGSYVLFTTDALDNILAIETTATAFNFEGIPAGNCRIWGMAYTGNLSAGLGDNLNTTQLSDDCFSLSSNFIDIIRGELEAGTIGLSNGLDEIYTCPADGEPNLVGFDSIGVSSSSYVYLLTDENNQLIQIVDGDAIDMEAFDAGTYYVHGLNYTSDLLVEAGDDVTQVVLAAGCYSLSNNNATIYHYAPSAGTITANGGLQTVEICIGDGIPDLVEFSVAGASNANYTYLVVEQDSFLIGTFTDDTFDFEQSSAGDWVIIGMSFTGTISALPGSNIFTDQLASGCHDLTEEPVLIDKTHVDGGIVLTDLGAQDLFVCADDGEPNVISFINSGTSTEATYQYVLTTDNNLVLNFFDDSFDFETAQGFSSLRVWGISYTGTLTLGLGQNLTEVSLSDGCASLSDNHINVYRDSPEGGVLSFEDGSTDLRFCHSNSMPGITVNTSSTSNAGYAYFVTDTANVILSTSLNDNFINFDDFSAGLYRIWGLSYTGLVTIEAGDTIPQIAMASSCHELSENFLSLERTESLDAGEITSLANGTDPLYICVDDGEADIHQFFTSSTDPNNAFVVTDTFGVILIPQIVGNILNFENSLPGVCRVYSISFTGDLDLNLGMNIFTDMLSSDCWALTDNYITVVRQNTLGGEVSTDGGLSTVTITVDDGQADVVTFENTGSMSASYAYIITDGLNNVIGTVDGNVADFEGVTPGVCHVWGLSYTGELTLNAGDNLTTMTSLSTGCADLSENFVTVTRLSSFDDNDNSFSQAQETTTATIKVAPIPANDFIQVAITNLAQETPVQQLIEVFDLTGLRVMSLPLDGKIRSYELNIQNLQSGIYFVRWSDGKNATTQRFIKQ